MAGQTVCLRQFCSEIKGSKGSEALMLSQIEGAFQLYEARPEPLAPNP